jgi:plastocyanin
MIDLEPDDIDESWRAGLANAVPVIKDGPARVETKLRQRQRVHRTRRSLAAVLAIVVVGGAIATLRRSQATNIQTRGPITRVTVDDGRNGTLSIVFPGRPYVDSSHVIAVPAGRVVFTIHYYGAHDLVLRGVPDFRGSMPPGTSTPHTVKTTVTLRPGRYELYCTVAGHRTAGEDAIIVVRDPAVSPPAS